MAAIYLLRAAAVSAAALVMMAASSSGATPPEQTLAAEVRGKGWIVYAARAEKKDWDLHICRPDGSDVRNLTNSAEFNEAYPLFSRDGKRLMYRRLGKGETIDGNHYGAQGQLVIANSDGSNPVVFGAAGEYPWASWSPDGKQIACLTVKGIVFVDVATKKVMRTLPRQGFFQQMTWSPDGLSLSGVANNFDTGWSVAKLTLATGKAIAIHRVDCCTPDFFPDSSRLIFSKRPGQWTQLWMADADGQGPRVLYAEEGRHVYGGHVSPDGKYILFTGNVREDGDPEHAGAPMNLMRLADAPILGGDVSKLKGQVPKFNIGPLLSLPQGWEPCWTFSEAPGGAKIAKPGAAAGTTRPDALAQELKGKGWIAFSAKTDAGDWDLYACRPDGSERRAITSTPDSNEGGVRFSPDGRRLLYYRMSKDEPLDNNTYGTFELFIADADGGSGVRFGNDCKWATWSPDGRQIACLRGANIAVVDLATNKLIREIPRKGIVQQLGWSPDGQWFCGTANGLGPAWNIGVLNPKTGQITAVSETDRYNCTPDWLGDSRQIVYSRGIVPGKEGFAEVWIGSIDGKERRVVYAEDKRHMYGGCVSPDGTYMLFTRSETDLGKVDNSKTRLSIVRLADAPVIVGDDPALRSRFPQAKPGPRLDLGWGWEPHWTSRDIAFTKAPQK